MVERTDVSEAKTWISIRSWSLRSFWVLVLILLVVIWCCFFHDHDDTSDKTTPDTDPTPTPGIIISTEPVDIGTGPTQEVAVKQDGGSQATTPGNAGEIWEYLDGEAVVFDVKGDDLTTWEDLTGVQLRIKDTAASVEYVVAVTKATDGTFTWTIDGTTATTCYFDGTSTPACLGPPSPMDIASGMPAELFGEIVDIDWNFEDPTIFEPGDNWKIRFAGPKP